VYLVDGVLLLAALVSTKLEVLASLDVRLVLVLALSALKTERNLLCRLSLLVEDRLGLTTETGLLPVVPSLPLRKEGGLARLILRHLVLGVLLALLARTKCLTGLRNIDPKPKTPSSRTVRTKQLHIPPRRVRGRRKDHRWRNQSIYPTRL